MERRVVVRGIVRDQSSEALTELLSGFERYPEYTSTVVSVDSEQVENGHKRSAWAIKFQDGILKWVQDEWVEPGRIVFKSVNGDFKSLEGSWSASQVGDDIEVVFDVTFVSGLGTLSEVVDPIAERILREDFETIMRAVIGDELELLTDAGAVAQTSERED
jgi:ribosome-associated toxin RatA of RatAB toxin-antitoxin module